MARTASVDIEYAGLKPSGFKAAELVEDLDDVAMDPEPLSEDLYGVGISSLMRDSRYIVAGGGDIWLRLSRVSVSTIVLFLTIFVQIFLVCEFKKLVTAQAVHEVREKYSLYERHMYSGNTFKTVNGFERGVDGFFDKARFDSLEPKLRKDVCSIPLSQPNFLLVILAIWSFTVVIDIRKIQFLADLLILRTPTSDTFKDMLEATGNGHEVVLNGVPAILKAMLCFLMFLPRLAIDLVLLWLGCRWLVATHSLSDVLLNAMALEFILLLKDLMYEAVVPARDKFDTQTVLIPHRVRYKPSCCGFLGSFAWLFVVGLWVWIYMYHIQMVLPHYKWDVSVACEDYIAAQSEV